MGNREKALRLYKEFLPEAERVLGMEHPEVEIIKKSIAGLGGTK